MYSGTLLVCLEQKKSLCDQALCKLSHCRGIAMLRLIDKWLFRRVDADGSRIAVDPADHLNATQVRKMACIPDLIWQFAEYLEVQHSGQSGLGVKVYADTSCSLNTREPAPLIDRLVDLTVIPRNEPTSNWVLPLSRPLSYLLFYMSMMRGDKSFCCRRRQPFLFLLLAWSWPSVEITPTQ